jgi:puromycin-sensitive aminopeptidase
VDFGTARSAAFDTDSLSTTRPIEYEVVTAADAEAMFDVLTYEKGASVVRMLQQYLGEGTFQQGIREYLRTHQHASTETTDLWDALEAASGEPVRQMMDAWIYRPGHPVVRIERNGGGIVVTQERFAFAPDPAGDVAPIAPEVRTVPLVLRVGLGGAEQLHRVLLEGPRQELDLGARPDWVVGNHEGNGFMRIQLGDEDLAALAAVAPRACSPAERYGLLEDEWALLLAGRTTVARLIGLVRSLAADDDLSVWRRTTAVLAGLHRLATPEQRPAFEGWVRALVAPALQALGDQPSPGESDRRSTLRAVLFEALGRTGADDHRRRQARRWFDELGRNPQALDAELSDATIGVVAAGSDPEVHQELWRRADAARTVQDRLRHLGAAADSADPSLVLAACDRYLGDGVRTQDAPFLLRRALTNPHATAGVWELITHRWSDAVDRFPSSTLPRMVEGIRTIADPALAERVAEFLRAHPLPQGSTVVDQHLERMWVSVALGRRVPDELAVALR